jgi:copper chaperone CopZ
VVLDEVVEEEVDLDEVVEDDQEDDLEEVEVDLAKEKAFDQEIVLLIEKLMIIKLQNIEVLDILLKEMNKDDKEVLQEEIVEVVVVLDEDNYF